ncbi:MAG: YbgA family protein, partial [Pseudomonadota bacterium]
IVLAHDEKRYRELGRLVATAGRRGMSELGRRYIQQLMQALKKPATRTRHANVLQHLFGFLKQSLDATDKRELLESIDTYRRGRVPLVVPITLLRHYLRRYPEPFLGEQYYLAPHPNELMLRNQI